MKVDLRTKFVEAEEFINSIPKFTTKNKPDHTRYFMNLLKNPQESFLTIHVAGSNGKGSVSAMINQMLILDGKKTGLFISPHLEVLTERFQINSKNASIEDFLVAFEQVKTAIIQLMKDGYAHPTYFEFLFAVGMMIFYNNGVEVAVLETGMGGRLDATNVIRSPLVSIITSISYEHTDVLGDTLPKIAFEKAGIIKQNRPVVFEGKHEEVNQVIVEQAAKKEATCYPVYPADRTMKRMDSKGVEFTLAQFGDKIIRVPFAAQYQAENAALAVRAGMLLCEMGHLTKESIVNGIELVRWPGRMEAVGDGIILDGAHNVDGIQVFVEAVKAMETPRKILLFSMVKEKNYEKVIDILSSQILWDEVIVTRVKGERGLDSNELLQLFLRDLSPDMGESCRIIDDNGQALEYAKSVKENGTVFCTGSLYLVGELRKIVGGNHND
ncbi:MAG: bifunctional folylpolyglutamate synthase/dihydrofolate synthase [Lachnospiraceae bacterium]|nr:bifunctional folylpolyglutamate synthase/dihydrofolate synthase [Lachnospiraceae bacterium]